MDCGYLLAIGEVRIPARPDWSEYRERSAVNLSLPQMVHGKKETIASAKLP
jgi:hypothetical protein